jgi:hypothetical protein
MPVSASRDRVVTGGRHHSSSSTSSSSSIAMSMISHRGADGRSMMAEAYRRKVAFSETEMPAS